MPLLILSARPKESEHSTFTPSTSNSACIVASCASSINNGISLLIDYDVNNKEDADKVEAFYEQIKDHSSIEAV
jgi:hypothetical protein